MTEITTRIWSRILEAGRPALLGLLVLLTAPAGAVPARALEKGEFDPAVWNALLKQFVSADGVDYAAWKAHGTGELDAFLDAAGRYDLKSILGKEPKAGFLINAYNAWAVRQILTHYPVASVKEIPGFFDRNTVRVAGTERTLDDLAAALVKLFPTDPQVVFAPAPGVRGFPELAPTAYTGENLKARLEQAAQRYLVERSLLTVDRKAGLLLVPIVITRHLDYFNRQEGGIEHVLSRWMSLANIMYVSKNHPELRERETDWSLNEASAQSNPPRKTDDPTTKTAPEGGW